jgi:hypothetical protein
VSVETGDTIAIKFEADVADLRSGMAAAAGDVGTGAAAIGSAAKSAEGGVGGLAEALREHSAEARTSMRTASLLSREFDFLGASAKGLSGKVLEVGAAFALGGFVGAAIPAIGLVIEAFEKLSGSAEKLEKIKIKIETQGLKEAEDALTDLNAEKMRAAGATDKEIAQYRAMRGDADATREIKAKQQPIEDEIVRLAARRAGIEATIQGLGASDVKRHKDLQEAADAYNGKIDTLRKKWQDIQDTIDEIHEKRQDTAATQAETKGITEGIQAQEAAERKADAEENRRREEQAKLDEKYGKKQVEEANKAAMALAEVQGKAAQKLREEQKKEQNEEFLGRVEFYNRETKEAEKAAEKAAQAGMSLGRTVGKTIGDSFAGVINGTKSVGDAFVSLADVAVDAVVDMVTKQVEAYAIQAAAGAAAAESPIPIVGPALAVAAAVAMGAMVKGLLSGLTKREAGGPVSSGTSYLVGERGPEVFTPGASGAITPNHALGGGGGDMHVHFHTPDPGSFERWLKKNRGSLAKVQRMNARDGR